MVSVLSISNHLGCLIKHVFSLCRSLYGLLLTVSDCIKKVFITVRLYEVHVINKDKNSKLDGRQPASAAKHCAQTGRPSFHRSATVAHIQSNRNVLNTPRIHYILD